MNNQLRRKAMVALLATIGFVITMATPASASTHDGEILALQGSLGPIDFDIPGPPTGLPCDELPDPQITVELDDTDPTQIVDIIVDSTSRAQLPGTSPTDPWFELSLEDSDLFGTNSGTIDTTTSPATWHANVGLIGSLVEIDPTNDCAPVPNGITCQFGTGLDLWGDYIGTLPPPTALLDGEGDGGPIQAGACDPFILSQLQGQDIVIDNIEVEFA